MSNAVSISTAVAEQPAAAEEPVDPAQQEAAARTHLGATRARLDALAQRVIEREERLTALAELHRIAAEAAERASVAAAAYPGDLATARARVLIAQS